MTNLTFFNEPNLKASLLAQLRADQEADRFIQGTYVEGAGETFRGCHIGCVTRTGKHEDVMRLYNLPLFVGYLGEYFFESLPPDRARTFSVSYIEAIPVGVNLSLAWPQFALALMARLRERNTEIRWNIPTILDDATHYFEAWIRVGIKPEAVEGAWAAEAARAAMAVEAAEAAWAASAARAVEAAWAVEAARAAMAARVAMAAEAARAAWAVEGAWAAEAARAARAARAAKKSELDWQLNTLLAIYRGFEPRDTGETRDDVVESCLDSEARTDPSVSAKEDRG